MTPQDLARLHARAMESPGAWSAQAFAELLATPGTFLVASSCRQYAGGSARGAEPLSPAATEEPAQSAAFALGRVVLDEAELLTLATDPDHRRRGLGAACLADFETGAARRGASTAFLEVAAGNAAARALYAAAGWQVTGGRRGYYRTEQGGADAILMRKPLAPT